jgi:mRNA-degrading endonuclease RelE of RelBE toxin-antitoxin system
MRPNPVTPWELRVGDYRIFYDVESAIDEAAEAEVVILAVGLKTGNRVVIGDEEHEL